MPFLEFQVKTSWKHEKREIWQLLKLEVVNGVVRIQSKSRQIGSFQMVWPLPLAMLTGFDKNFEKMFINVCLNYQAETYFFIIMVNSYFRIMMNC